MLNPPHTLCACPSKKPVVQWLSLVFSMVIVISFTFFFHRLDRFSSFINSFTSFIFGAFNSLLYGMGIDYLCKCSEQLKVNCTLLFVDDCLIGNHTTSPILVILYINLCWAFMYRKHTFKKNIKMLGWCKFFLSFKDIYLTSKFKQKKTI